MVTFLLLEIQTKWAQVEVQLDIGLIKLRLLTSKITKITKYQSFQYRLMYRTVMLNDKLYHYNASPTQKCSFCHKVMENYHHFFLDCEISRQILEVCVDYIKRNICIDLELTFEAILYSSTYVNLVILLYKQNLYSAKCQIKSQLQKVS